MFVSLFECSLSMQKLSVLENFSVLQFEKVVRFGKLFRLQRYKKILERKMFWRKKSPFFADYKKSTHCGIWNLPSQSRFRPQQRIARTEKYKDF